MKRIINVSNRLPITIKENNIHPSDGGLVSALEGVSEDFDLFWVGIAGEKSTDTAKQNLLKKKLEKNYNYLPLFLEKKEIENYYDGFSNTSIWPLFHYMPTHYQYKKEWFEGYLSVNQQFAKTILDTAKNNDIVWIHDYHLMLLPAILKKKNPSLKIGFFFHTPFPSYEIFRCHPNRLDLLEGILGADLVGFHTFGYLRHFRSSILRLLELETDIYSIHFDGRLISMGVFPIGINWTKFQRTLESTLYKDAIKLYKSKYKDKKLVLSVERMDYTKGIPHKLNAIEAFLKTYPELSDKVVFILIAVPSREDVKAYIDLKYDVQNTITSINGKYSTLTNIPIHFINRAISFPELTALYSVSDIALVTPLIDGMNLVAKEYIACQQNNTGVLILSEFAGAAHELFASLMVNPYNETEVAETIYKGLKLLKPSTKKEMNKMMRKEVITNDSVFWAKNFINSLTSNQKRDLISIKPLSKVKSFLKKQSKNSKKAFFFDYDGTLREFESNPNKATPTPEIKKILTELLKLPHTDIFIISGRNKEFLTKHFSDLNIGLIAEHGYMYSEKNSKSHRQWNLLHKRDRKTDWKKHVKEMLDLYNLSTPGSHIEEKNFSLVWHYRQADPEFGQWKANELITELNVVCSNLPVEIHQGKKIVEIRSQYVNKGIAMDHFLSKKKYDFVLCAGDDQTDETMLGYKNGNIFTIKIGNDDTVAKYKIPSPKSFRAFLTELIELVKKLN